MTVWRHDGVMPRVTIRQILREFRMRVVTVANEPAQRFKLLWYLVAWGCASVFFVIGVGYAGAGHGAIQSQSLKVVSTLEGNLHIHGILMIMCSTFLVYGLNDYRRVTKVALMLYLFYSLWTAMTIFVGWGFNGISWGAPWWYVLSSFLSGSLIVLAPPLDKNGKRFKGLFERDDSV